MWPGWSVWKGSKCLLRSLNSFIQIVIPKRNPCGTHIIKIWLYVLVMSSTCFRLNPHFIVAWMQGTPCSKQVRNLKFKLQQLDSNPEPLSSSTNTQPFGQTGQDSAFESSCSHLIKICLNWCNIEKFSKNWSDTCYAFMEIPLDSLFSSVNS